MKKLAVIKSEKSLEMVTNLYAKKIMGKIAFYGDVHVDVEKYVKGQINHIVVWFDHNMLCFAGLDSVREITDAMEQKYDHFCVCTTIQTRPYLTKDGKYWLHRPVVEISLRVKE